MKANLDRSEGPAQYLRGLRLSSSLHVTEDNGLSILCREPIDLFVQFGVIHGFGPTFYVVSKEHDFGLPAFGDSLARRIAPGAPRHAEGYAVQPRAKGFRFSNGSGFPRQYQKDSLCCILCFMPISKNVPTHAVNHRPMSVDESGESGFG